MKIGIVTFNQRQGGPSVYAYNLITHLMRLYPEHEYYIFTDTSGLFVSRKNIHVVTHHVPTSAGHIIWDQMLLPFYARRYMLDIVHHTKQGLPFLPLKSYRVVTIHDVAPFLFPDSFTRLQRWDHQCFARIAARRANAIITESVSSKKDIAATLHVSPQKVHAIPLGVDQIFHVSAQPDILRGVRDRYELPDRYILSVSTLQPRKNIDTIITAFARVVRTADIAHHLVIAGRKGWLYNELFSLAQEQACSDRIHFIGHVPDPVLPAVYQGADMFISASSYEGFGLTTVEALASGVPVIGTDVSATPEVIGDTGVLVPPRDPRRLADAMVDLLRDDERRKLLAQKACRQAQRFTWDACARATMDIYCRGICGT